MLVVLAAARSLAQPIDAGTAEPQTIVSAPRAATSDVTSTVSVVRHEDLVRSPALTVDALVRLEPSALTFRRSTSLAADPTSQGINLRGLGPSAASRTLVLLDGQPLNDGFGGWVYWRAVPRLGLDRVELALGPGSALWGNSAMGGVVQLISRPIDGPAADADVAYGSFNTSWVAVRGATRFGRLAASLEGELLRSDGYPVVAAYDRGAVDRPASSLHGSLNGRVEWAPEPELRLTARASVFAQEQSGGTAFTRAAVAMTQGSLTVDWRPPGRGRLEVALLARSSRFEQLRARVDAERATEVLAAEQRVPVSEQTLSAVWAAPSARLLGTHRVSTGLDFRRVTGTSHEVLVAAARTRDAGGEQHLAGLFVQDLWSPASWVEISAAARLDVWRSFDGVTVEQAAITRHPDRGDVQANPRIGVLVRPASWLSLKASGARAFRAPTLNELYRPFQVGTVLTAANPALAAETVWSAEAGIEVRGPAGLTARATGFWSEWLSPIVNVTLDAPLPSGAVRQRQNLGAARVRGVELAVDFRPTRVLAAKLAYTFTDSAVTRSPAQPGLEGKRLPQDPQHRGLAMLVFDDPRWFTATLQARVLGPQFEDDANLLAMGGYVLLDAALSRRLWWGLEVYVAAENLLDRTYLVGRAGVDTIGAPFTFRAGLRLRQPEAGSR